MRRRKDETTEEFQKRRKEKETPEQFEKRKARSRRRLNALRKKPQNKEKYNVKQALDRALRLQRRDRLREIQARIDAETARIASLVPRSTNEQHNNNFLASLKRDPWPAAAIQYSEHTGKTFVVNLQPSSSHAQDDSDTESSAHSSLSQTS